MKRNRNSSSFIIIFDILLVALITHDQAFELSSSISDQEITDALKDINDYKILGLDKFTSKIFIHSWDIIGKQFLSATHHFFKIQNSLKYSDTLITIIPTVKRSNSISDHKCIFLYNI